MTDQPVRQAACDAAEGTQEPFAWTIPGDDQEDCNGFIPTKVVREGEFTKPLYAAPPKPAPGHTDLMVTPESLDAFMEKNTLPASDDAMQREALALAKQLQHAKDAYDNAVGRGQFPRFIQEKKESIDFLLWCSLKDIIEWLQTVSSYSLEAEVPATPVPPADGALGRAWEALARLRAMTPTEFKAYHSCVDLFETALRALPSPAVAVEPVAWRKTLSKIKRLALDVKPEDVPLTLAYIARLCIDAGSATPDQRNWIEDASHENGNYECMCCECDQMFIGYKRRVVCKACSKLLATSPVRGDRETIARYVCGHFLCALDDCSCEPGAAAFKHADAILSLPVQSGAGERWRTDIENAPKDNVLFMLRQNKTACVACFELRGQDGGGVWLDEADAQIFPIAWMLIPGFSSQALHYSRKGK